MRFRRAGRLPPEPPTQEQIDREKARDDLHKRKYPSRAEEKRAEAIEKGRLVEKPKPPTFEIHYPGLFSVVTPDGTTYQATDVVSVPSDTRWAYIYQGDTRLGWVPDVGVIRCDQMERIINE